jgi:hypothetical protein
VGSDQPQFAGFISAFSLMLFGEFGDKTQLVTISLAVQYGAHPAIWVGEMLAIVPVSLVTQLLLPISPHFSICGGFGTPQRDSLRSISPQNTRLERIYCPFDPVGNTFQCRHEIHHHVPEVDLDSLTEECDGRSRCP